MGSAKRPRVSTFLLASAITIMRVEAAATIFSRNKAPPPPLIRRKGCVQLVGTVHGEIEPRRLVEGGERDALGQRLGTRRFGGGNAGDLEAATHLLAEKCDEKLVRRRARAKSQVHAVGDDIYGARGKPFVSVHPHSLSVTLLLIRITGPGIERNGARCKGRIEAASRISLSWSRSPAAYRPHLPQRILVTVSGGVQTTCSSKT